MKRKTLKRRASKLELWRFIKYALLSIILVFGLASIIATGGGGGGSSSTGGGGSDTPEASAVIGPEGGVVEVTDADSKIFGTKIEIEANSLSMDTTITISEFKDYGVFENVNKVIEIGPEGVNFSIPATIHIPYIVEKPGGILDETTNAIFTFNSTDEVWEVVGTVSVDLENNFVSGLIDHLSVFTVSKDSVRNETPQNLQSGYPLLLVHGVTTALQSPKNDADKVFGVLKTYLEDLGFDVWSFNYNTARWIEISAGNLGEAIDGILGRKRTAGYSGNEGISIICHSMGGLVTRAYIQQYGLKWVKFFPWPETAWVPYNGEIDSIIMTAVPNHGSVWGAINYAAAIEPHARKIHKQLRLSSVQMIPGSDFLDNLNDPSMTPLPKEIEYHVIHGYYFESITGKPNDGIVLRSSSELSEWEAISGYNITNYTVTAAHVKISFVPDPFKWEPGIAYIETREHPTWEIIYTILSSWGAEENLPPAVTITFPAPSSTFEEGEAITFQGEATDPEDGPLTGSSLVWTSSIDGEIGTEESFQRDDLSVGTHTITLTATDSEEASGTDSIQITIIQQNVFLSDDFEDGDVSDWQNYSGATFSATTAYKASGNYSGEHKTGTYYHDDRKFAPTYRQFAPQTGSFTAEFDFMSPDIGGAYNWKFVHITDAEPSGYNSGYPDNSFLVGISCGNLDGAGNYDGYGIYYSSNGTWHYTGVRFEDYEWKHFKFVIDVSSQVYDLYVDGSLIASNIPFYRSASSLSYFHISSESSTCYIDNVRLYEDNGGGEIDIRGYWNLYHTTEGKTGEEGPGYLTFDQLNNDVTIHDTCYYPEETEYSSAINGTTISISWTNESGTTTSCTGLISDDTIVGTWTETSGYSGTWRAEKTEQEPTLEDCVVSTTHVWCVRFLNGRYDVEGRIKDPNGVIESAHISGDYISGTSPLTYNLYVERPSEWWTDPNIFISQGVEPDFPLEYIVHIEFKDGTSQNVSKTVTDWQWAQ